jgi:dihydrofolate synthase/folylpolyglutamate synthase
MRDKPQDVDLSRNTSAASNVRANDCQQTMHTDRSYLDTIEYLFALQKQGIKLELSNSIRLMQLMGDPHERFRTVHVAGTNGKGSTSVLIAGMLQAAGFRTGLYTSPHLISFTERIRINGVPVTEEKVVDLAHRVRDAYQASSEADAVLNPTFFEVTTAMAFTYFAEESVDIAVIEVGMGGRLDSTNVITPMVSVITNVDLEHTEYLGTTLTQIAGEKAGIIKPGVPVVTGSVQPEVLAVIEGTAADRNAPLFLQSRDFRPAKLISSPEHTFDYVGIRSSQDGLRLGMIGRHQVDNACLALAAIECLGWAGFTVSDDAVKRGCMETRWPGRLELAARSPDIILDGAHNPAAAGKLAHAIRELRTSYSRMILVIGILADKDYHGIIAELVPLASEVIVTKPRYSRALDSHLLAAEIGKMHAPMETTDTVEEALARAMKTASPADLSLITGSLYVVGDARAALCSVAGAAGLLSGLKG